MIKQKIDNYIIPITLMFVMGMMLFRVNDPLCLKTIFLLMLTFAVKPFGTYRWTLIDWSILIIWGYDIISCCVSINKYPSICFLQLSTNCFLAYHLVRYSFANTKERNLQKGFLGLSCIAVILSFFTFFFFYKNFFLYCRKTFRTMFGIDKGRNLTSFLKFSNHMKRKCCFARTFWSVDFNNSTCWNSSNSKCDI